jgi:1,4-alpha-glucan branching enzyme
MKISNRVKPTELAAQGARSQSSFRITPTNQRVNPTRRLQPGGAKNVKTNVIKGRIRNFSYLAPAAMSVQLVGDFTCWQAQPINLRKTPNGWWWTAVRLGPGTHYCRFLVDGQRRDDPECPLSARNPFGSQNAVRRVN